MYGANSHQRQDWERKPTFLAGHHLDSQRLKDDMQVNMSSLVRVGGGPEKTRESDIVGANVHTDSTIICDFQESYTVQSVPLTCFMISLYLWITSADSFKCYFTSPALALGMHFNMVAGVAYVTVIQIELLIRHFFNG